jgi:hypothetical protein
MHARLRTNRRTLAKPFLYAKVVVAEGRTLARATSKPQKNSKCFVWCRLRSTSTGLCTNARMVEIQPVWGGWLGSAQPSGKVSCSSSDRLKRENSERGELSWWNI